MNELEKRIMEETRDALNKDMKEAKHKLEMTIVYGLGMALLLGGLWGFFIGRAFADDFMTPEGMVSDLGNGSYLTPSGVSINMGGGMQSIPQGGYAVQTGQSINWSPSQYQYQPNQMSGNNSTPSNYSPAYSAPNRYIYKMNGDK